MKAVVLVAGLPGRDFPPDCKPKCLYHRRGRILLEQLLEAIWQGGIADVRLVVGYKAESIREFAASRQWDLEFVHNEAWAEDAVTSIESGMEGVATDLLLISGDIIIDASLIRAFLETPRDRLAWIRSLIPWDPNPEGWGYDAVYRPDIDNSIVKIPHHMFGIMAGARQNAERFLARYPRFDYVRPAHGLYYGAAITETFYRNPPVEEVVIRDPLPDVDFCWQTDEYLLARFIKEKQKNAAART